MKIKTFWIILFLITSVLSCKKQNFENFEEAMSITELFNYTGAFSIVNCDEELPQANDTVSVFGWVGRVEETEYANHFFLYESETLPAKELEVHVMENSYEIFRKIKAKTHGSKSIQIWIRGKIVFYKARYEDGTCRIFVGLHIYNESDIYI